MTPFTHLSQSVPMAFAAPVKPGDMQRGQPCPKHKPLWQPSSFLGLLLGPDQWRSCELWSLPQRPPRPGLDVAHSHIPLPLFSAVCALFFTQGAQGFTCSYVFGGPLTSSHEPHVHAHACTNLVHIYRGSHTRVHRHCSLVSPAASGGEASAERQLEKRDSFSVLSSNSPSVGPVKATRRLPEGSFVLT